MPKINMIAAIDSTHGLAIGHKIPWQLPSDTKYYQDKTRGQPIVLGKNTYFLMGHKTLAARYSYIYVLSHEQFDVPNGTIITNIGQYVQELREDIWVLGSGQVYTQFLPYAQELYLTRVQGDFGCDIFFPAFEDSFSLRSRSDTKVENGIQFWFEVWVSQGRQ